MLLGKLDLLRILPRFKYTLNHPLVFVCFQYYIIYIKKPKNVFNVNFPIKVSNLKYFANFLLTTSHIIH